MGTESWAHQRAAFEFVEELWKNGRRGAMLALVMGAGKSKVAVDLASAFDLNLILILCPLRVVEVWRQQFMRWAPGRYTFAALDDQVDSVKAKTQRARELLEWAKAHRQPLVICTNYESARTEPFARWALSRVWNLVILDESHKIKSASGRTSRYCGRLGMMAQYRLCLTGTPMPHFPIDIWGQFRFLDPNLLDATYGSFKKRHAVMGGYLDKQVIAWQNMEQLHDKFYSLAYRVDESVLDLPPQLDQTLSVHLTGEGRRIYDEMAKEMITWIRNSEKQGIEVTAKNALVRLLRLHQITGGALPDQPGHYVVIDHTKENLLADFLDDLPAAEPVVVFARFKSDLEAIRRASGQVGRRAGELSGERDDLAGWQRGGVADPTVLAVQIQAGGVGISLTRAHIVVYYSFDFNLANYLQSRARIRRAPQTRPCLYYHLQIADSIDGYILRAIEARQDLIDSVLEDYREHTNQRPEYSIPG